MRKVIRGRIGSYQVTAKRRTTKPCRTVEMGGNEGGPPKDIS
nr:MAG TPA: hypothetical protein [Caudoviricetes sp.]